MGEEEDGGGGKGVSVRTHFSMYAFAHREAGRDGRRDGWREGAREGGGVCG